MEPARRTPDPDPATPRWSRWRRVGALLAVVALVASACSGGGDDAASDPADEAAASQNDSGDESNDDPVEAAAGGSGAGLIVDPDLVIDEADTTWDVELASDAVVLDDDLAAAVLEVDSGTFVFDAGAFDPGLVAVGEVMVVPGVGMGRVTGIDESGDRVAVTTSETNLGEVIENGTMAWEAPLDLTEGFMPGADSGGVVQPASLRPGGSEPLRSGETRFAGLSVIDPQGGVRAVPTALDQAGNLEWIFKGDGNEYLFRLTPTASKIDFTVQVKREVAGKATLAYTAKGTLETVTSTGSATYDGGELSSMSIEQKDLAGRLDLSIAAAGSGAGDIDFTLPGLMFKYIVMVGPVPVTIGITTKVIGSIKVPAEASATAEASFDYSGATGFTFADGSFEAKGDLAGLQMNPEPADSSGLIGTAVDAQFGVAFPRFQISIFDQLLVPYLHTGFTIGSSLTWGPVCKRAYVRTNVDAGYDFKVLGVTLHSDKTSLFEQQRRAEQDGCPDLPDE